MAKKKTADAQAMDLFDLPVEEAKMNEEPVEAVEAVARVETKSTKVAEKERPVKPMPVPKAKPARSKPETGAPSGGAKGTNVSIYLQHEDLTTARKLRARLALDLDQDANQSQLLRAGLFALTALPSDQVGELIDRVKAQDGRKRQA